MVNTAWRCVCCALPRRVLEHVARKTGDDHAVRLGEHHETSQHIRSQRHEHAQARTKPARGGQRRRLVYDAGGRLGPLPGELVRAEGAAAARDKAVNQAYENLGITLDFFREVFGRDSLDGRGMDVLASVHFGDGFSNAMWNGEQMLFGDGDGVHIRGFTQSLDIVAHELTHAVTHHSVPGGLGMVRSKGKVDLVGEAGALNESISDVFASLVKQWHGKTKARDADWLLGKGILGPGLGKAVRSLKNPGRTKDTYEDDDQVPDMRGYVEGGDVHRNSGIPNHAFYLAATELRGYAWEHAGRIWYESLTLLRKDSGFRDAAQATLATAGRLFGTASKEQQAVQQAWKKVGVLRG
jgi:Zn-dependent metalloprotease